MDEVVHIEEGEEDGARAQVLRGEADGLHPTGALLRPACQYVNKPHLYVSQATQGCICVCACKRICNCTCNCKADSGCVGDLVCHCTAIKGMGAGQL